MKIVFADPPRVTSSWLIANHPNLGILYLCGYLREKLDDVQTTYLDVFHSLGEHLRLLEEIDPDIYGLSFGVMREGDAFQTIREVRRRFPDLPIICGGPYPTAMAGEILKEHPVDVCVRGEGEAAMVDLVAAYREGTPLDAIRGIAFRRKGEVVFTEPRKPIGNLDDIPFPAWDMVDFNRYSGSYQYMGKPSTILITSRGCPFDCVFCANPVWKLSKPWLRMRSPANICREISLLYGMGVRDISIRSDELNPMVSWATAVCREIGKLGLRDLYFQGNIRADRMTDELAREMKKSNFWLVQMGIESGSQRTLDGIGKRITLEQVVEACRTLKRHGIKVYGYIMIYHAWEEEGKLCFETPEDVERTLNFVKKLNREKLLDYISFSTTTPMVGSRLFDIARRHGIIRRGQGIEDLSQFSMELPGVSVSDMKRSRRKGLLLQMMINLKSGHNNFGDWSKNLHKIKALLRSI